MQVVRRSRVRLSNGATSHDLSYANSAQSAPGRVLIRVIENTTGRRQLIRRAQGYEDDLAAGQSFFEVMATRYRLSLDVIGGSLDLIPREGPLVVVANHPYGILDGLMLGHILSHRRADFRIIANDVFAGAPDLKQHLLPISFDVGKAALAQNLTTRRAARELLHDGGALGIFPGGTVSTGAHPFAMPLDPAWRSFTARMIAKSNARVVPIFFEGHTSRMFQIASHLHHTLRLGLLINEFRKRVDGPVRVAIGAPLDRDQLDPLCGDAKAMMDFLRKATYDLSPKPVTSDKLGFEFEQHYRA